MDTTIDAEDAVIDFPAFLTRTDANTRDSLQGALNAIPAAARPAAQDKLAAVYSLAISTGGDPSKIIDQWPTIRGGKAVALGMPEEAKFNDTAFLAGLKPRAEKQRAERHLIQGLDDPKAPDAKAKRESSLVEMSREAAIGGEDYGAALANWQAQNRGKPGYDDARAGRYAQISAAEHKAAADDLEIARPVAEQAHELISTARKSVLPGEGNIAPFELFRGLTPNQKQMAFRVMADASGSGADKSDWAGLVLASQESTYRGLENLALGGGAAAYRSRLLGTTFAAGDTVRSANGVDEVKGRFMAEMVSRAGANSAIPAFYSQPERKLTSENAASWNVDVKMAVEDVDTSEELRAFGQGVIDPTRTKGDPAGRRALLSAADSMALMSSMAIPGAGAATFQLRAAGYQNDEYRSLRAKFPTMDASEANKMAMVTSIAQAGLDMAEFSVLGKGLSKIPGTQAVLQRLASANGVARFGVNFAATTTAETIIELAQDYIVPAMVQDSLKSDPAFDVKQADVWMEAIKAAPETALGMVLLSGFGGIVQTHEQSQASAMELSPAATILRTGDVPGALAALETEQATLAAKQTVETAASAEAANYAVRVVSRNGAWEVTTEGGETITVDSAEAARRIRNDLALTATQREADTLVAEAEAIPSNPETGVGVAFTGQKVRVTEGGTTSQGVLDPVEKYAPLKGKGLDTLHEEAQRVAETTGDGDLNAIVNGSNTVTFREDVAEGAKRITQEIEVNRTEDPAIFTLLHEKVEAVSRTLAEKAARGEAGGMTLAEQAATIAPLAPHFDPATAKGETEKLLFEQVQKVARGEASAVEAQETLSELAVGEVMRRRKDGTPVRSRMTEAMSAALDAATDPAQVKALGRLRATINALRTYFRAVLGTVAALRRANKEGKSADFEALIDKLTGVDEQAKHDMGAMKDAEAMLKKEGVDIQGISASKTYRLSAGNRLEAFQRRADEAIARDPVKRRIIKERIAVELKKLQHNVETERQTWKGDRIRPIVEKRTKAELDKEQGAFQAFQADERIKRGMDEKQAHEQARKQSAEWRAEQDRMQKEDWGGRSPLVRDLRALDAVLSVVGPEIRGKVGGHTKLATLGSEQARLAEFQKRLTKLNTELERSLRTEYDDALNALFDKAKPKKDGPGKKKVGKAGADVHALFDTLRQAVDWDAQTAEAHIAGLESAIATGELSPAEEAHKLQEIGLVNLVADWKNADAARRATAVDEATRVFRAGYAEFGLEKALQAEMRQQRRDALKKATGKAGTPGERDARMERDTGIPAKWEKIRLNLAPFEQVLWYAFGEKSTDAQRLADSERDASNAKTDEIQAAEMALQAAFTGMAGDELKGAQLHWKLAQKSLEVQGRRLSELEAITATLMWRQPDGRRHMEGKVDASGQVLSGWHYDQAFIDEIESKLSDEAKAVRSFLATDYAGEWATLNPVYREVNGIDLPHNPNYSPLTVKPQQAQGGQSIDPVTGTTMAGASTTPGSLRTRGNAVAEPDFRDAVQTWIAHKKQMAHWKAYAKLSAEMSALLNNRDVRNSVEAAAGKEAIGVISGWNDFLAQGGTRDAAAHLALNQEMRGAVGRATSVALVGRATTIAVQSTQLAAAAAEMPAGAYFKRLGLLLSGNLDWSAALASPYIQRRIREMPPVVRAGLEGLRAGKPNQLKHQVQRLGSLISGADGLFTAGTYAIVHDWRFTEAVKAGLPEADARGLATTEAERITDRVAQPTRAGTRSLFENTLKSPLAKLGWAFASEARKNFGVVSYALANRPAGQKAAAVLSLWVVGSVMASIIRSTISDIRDRDDDELFDSKHWSMSRIALAMLTEPLSGIPVVGDAITDGIYSMFGVYRPQGTLLDTRRAAKAVTHIDDILRGERDMHDTLNDLDAMLSAMGWLNEDAAAAASLSHVVKDLYGTPAE